MEWWKAVVLGLVEGITEYLPVSSTGHLILASSFLGLAGPATKDAVDAFDIVIQGGAILAVVGLYAGRVKQMLYGLAGRDPAGLRLLRNLIVAFLPAAVTGVFLDDLLEEHLFHTGPVLAALVLGAVYMLVVDRWVKKKYGPGGAALPELDVADLTPMQAFKIGALQCVAMWPGTSRSMMTITGGLWVGLGPRQAAEFSFLLGLPTLGAATCYALFKNLRHASKTHTPNLFEMLGVGSTVVGVVVAAVSAAFAVKWLVGFLNRRGLAPFAYYRLALGAVLLALSVAGVVKIGT